MNPTTKRILTLKGRGCGQRNPRSAIRKAPVLLKGGHPLCGNTGHPTMYPATSWPPPSNHLVVTMARRRVASPSWLDVHGLFYLRLKDAMEVLGISTPHLKLLCRKNGLPRWPGKMIRSLMANLHKLTVEAAMPGAANHRPPPLKKIEQEAREVTQKLVRILARIRSPAPEVPEQGGDGTVNLLDSVGVSRGSDY